MSTPVSESPSRRFHEESGEIIEYRSISPMAIVTFFLGLASCSALASPVMWVVPILAVAAGAKTWRTIKANQTSMRGEGFVLVGLSVAMFAAGYAPVQHYYRQRTLFAQSREYIEQWFELVRSGKIMEAHQLQMAFTERVNADSRIGEEYQNTMTRMKFDAFKTGSPMKELIRWGDQAVARYVGGDRIDTRGNEGVTTDIVTQRFELSKEGAAMPRPMVVEVDMVRQAFHGVSESRWQMKEIRIVSAPSNLP